MNNKGHLLKKWILITLCCAAVAFAIPFLTETFMARDGDPVVIVLDPGHGGADVGAVNPEAGLYESDINLAIALACRDELMRYDGVSVYMTHTGIDYSDGVMSLTDRINYVNEVGGDILISLHTNAAENPEARGSEVYVSHSQYKPEYNQESTQLATCFLKQFRQLGLGIRGVKLRLSNGDRRYYHDDGTEEIGDYYAVIGGTIKKYGIPGILVEHAFIDGDSSFLSSQENLRQLGIADATAIAEHYGLQLKRYDDEIIEPEEEAVFVTDADIASASDVSAQIVALPANISVSDYERLQKIRVSYEALTYEGKTLVDDELTDILYRSVLDLDCRIYPVRIAAVEESGINVNRINHTVSGLDLAAGGLSGTNVASLLENVKIYVDTANVSNAAQLEVSGAQIVAYNADGAVMDLGLRIGTGCVLRLIAADGTVIDEVTVVTACDISGDGAVDSYDQQLLDEYIAGVRELTPAQLLAADVNGDGRINDRDVSAIFHEIVED